MPNLSLLMREFNWSLLDPRRKRPFQLCLELDSESNFHTGGGIPIRASDFRCKFWIIIQCEFPTVLECSGLGHWYRLIPTCNYPKNKALIAKTSLMHSVSRYREFRISINSSLHHNFLANFMCMYIFVYLFGIKWVMWSV